MNHSTIIPSSLFPDWGDDYDDYYLTSMERFIEDCEEETHELDGAVWPRQTRGSLRRGRGLVCGMRKISHYAKQANARHNRKASRLIARGIQVKDRSPGYEW